MGRESLRIGGIRLTNNREPRLAGKDHRSNGVRLFRVGQQVHAKNIFWDCIEFISLAFVPSISSMSRVESNRIQESNRIERKNRSHFRFHSTDFISYPQVRIKTDDEALNERKNAIDDTHTSRRHYYPRNNLIEGGSFLSRWSVSVSHDDLRSLTLCGADTFYRDLIRLSSNPCKSFRVSELRTPNLGSSTLRI